MSASRPKVFGLHILLTAADPKVLTKFCVFLFFHILCLSVSVCPRKRANREAKEEKREIEREPKQKRLCACSELWIDVIRSRIVQRAKQQRKGMLSIRTGTRVIWSGSERERKRQGQKEWLGQQTDEDREEGKSKGWIPTRNRFFHLKKRGPHTEMKEQTLATTRTDLLVKSLHTPHLDISEIDQIYFPSRATVFWLNLLSIIAKAGEFIWPCAIQSFSVLPRQLTTTSLPWVVVRSMPLQVLTSAPSLTISSSSVNLFFFFRYLPLSLTPNSIPGLYIYTPPAHLAINRN